MGNGGGGLPSKPKSVSSNSDIAYTDNSTTGLTVGSKCAKIKGFKSSHLFCNYNYSIERQLCYFSEFYSQLQTLTPLLIKQRKNPSDPG